MKEDPGLLAGCKLNDELSAVLLVTLGDLIDSDCNASSTFEGVRWAAGDKSRNGVHWMGESVLFGGVEKVGWWSASASPLACPTGC